MFMMLGLFCLVMGVPHLAHATFLTCPAPSEGSTIRRLKSSLLCNYDPQERPVKNKEDNVTVKFYLTIKHLSFIDYQNKYEVSAYFYMVWQDELLVWESKDFDDITEIHIPSHEMWFPDLMFRSSEMNQHDIRGENSCRVKNTGQVVCVPQVNTIVHGEQKLSQWPYDKQSCELSVLSYSEPAEKIELNFIANGGYSNVRNNDWKILKINATIEREFVNNLTWICLNYIIDIERHADLYAVAVVIPAFVMSALTLINFWVRGVTCRACICCTALIGDVLCLLFIGMRINASGTSTPKIALFYRDAMYMTILALVLGVFVERLRDRTSNIQAPVWLVNGASWLQVRGGRAGQLLLGDEEVEITDNHESAGKTTHCITYANLLDRLAFFGFFITYSITLTALLP